MGGPLLNDDGQDAQGVATLPSESDEVDLDSLSSRVFFFALLMRAWIFWQNSEAQQDDA